MAATLEYLVGGQMDTPANAELILNIIKATPEPLESNEEYEEGLRRRAMSKSGAGFLPELPRQALLDQSLGGCPSTLASSGDLGPDFSFRDEGNAFNLAHNSMENVV